MKNEFGFDHNESQISAWWSISTFSLVTLAFAMIGGNPPSRQSAAAKKNAPPNHGKHKSTATAVTDPLVNPGSPPHRHQTFAQKRIQPAHVIAMVSLA